MSVVPLKKYPYDEGCRIAAQVNAMRAPNGRTPWPANEVCNLFNELFAAHA